MLPVSQKETKETNQSEALVVVLVLNQANGRVCHLRARQARLLPPLDLLGMGTAHLRRPAAVLVLADGREARRFMRILFFLVTTE